MVQFCWDLLSDQCTLYLKGVYVPIGGKQLINFMDDFNMPAKDTFGSQPPLELIRLWLDYGFWYDRLKQTVKYIKVRLSILVDAWYKQRFIIVIFLRTILWCLTVLLWLEIEAIWASSTTETIDRYFFLCY